MHDITAARKLLQSPETLATVAHAIVRKQYGEPVYDWDIITVYMEAQADFKVDMDSVVADRIGAIQTIMTTDAFFKRLDAFLAISNTLAGGDPYFEMFDPATTEEMAWAIAEVSLNREMLPFSYGIKQYLLQQLKADGYDSDYPDIFDYVLEPKEQEKSLRDVLNQLYLSPNRENVDMYINDNLKDIASQFGQIPSLDNVDDILMTHDNAVVSDILDGNNGSVRHN